MTVKELESHIDQVKKKNREYKRKWREKNKPGLAEGLQGHLDNSAWGTGNSAGLTFFFPLPSILGNKGSCKDFKTENY